MPPKLENRNFFNFYIVHIHVHAYLYQASYDDIVIVFMLLRNLIHDFSEALIQDAVNILPHITPDAALSSLIHVCIGSRTDYMRKGMSEYFLTTGSKVCKKLTK